MSPGLNIYGDKAYVNTPYTTPPFKAVSSGIKDAYNVYHSQLRINIEYTFGMLLNRWGVSRLPSPLNINLKKYHWLDVYVVYITI